ncbi:MAG: hypothetical protein ACLGH0_06195, partial [Thermoanaerobaculia bacterium]
MAVTAAYEGPQCPRCSVTLTGDWLRSGTIVCPYCSRPFEATAFQPQQRTHARVDLVVAGPEGANACAFHARNAAVTSCKRCGVLICALCELNVGEGSFCPQCFDRVQNEGALRGAAKRYRDYASLARSTAILGTFLSLASAGILGLPVGIMMVVHGFKGRKQRLAEGLSATSMVVVMVWGVLVAIGGAAMIGVFAWSAA